MNAIQQQLVELRPGRCATINGRKVFGTYQGWQIYGHWPHDDGYIYATSLPEAVERLTGKAVTDAA